MRIAQVRLNGCDVPHAWDFPPGVTVIVGEVGGGKTSLLNLIKFGLGGRAPITNEISEAANSVSLDVQVGERMLTLTREFGTNIVMAGEGDRPARRYALQRGARHPWLSDLLLDALGIPSLRVRQARSEKSKSRKVTSISFEDVFAYCYLDQEQVDRSTVYDADHFRDPKRQWTFELLYRLIDAEVAELEVASLGLRETAEKREARIAVVEEFVDERGLQLQSDVIESRLAEIADAEAKLIAAREEAREEADHAVDASSAAQEDVTQLEDRLGNAQAEHQRVSIELDGIRRAANQLRRDLGTVQQAADARDTLDVLPFVTCPRCEQELDSRPHQEGECVLCLQPEPSDDAVDLEIVTKRLDAQLKDTRRLEETLAAAEASAAADVADTASALKETRARIHRHIEAASAPYIRRITDLQAELGALQGERRSLTESHPVTLAMRTEREELQAVEPEIATLEDRAEQRRAALAPLGMDRVAELSKSFDQILRRFTLPWLETAEVDPVTYLPKVNGRSLRDLSSGGMKATTNVAYYMGLLVTAMRDRDILMPNFLMLDSVRKDYGGGEKDLARSERIYDYLRTLQSMRTTQGSVSADFQLIVVDNDLPAPFENVFNTMPIDPDRPLIRSS